MTGATSLVTFGAAIDSVSPNAHGGHSTPRGPSRLVLPLSAMPPVANVALAFAAGVALARPGALWTVAPLLAAAALLAPIRASWRLNRSSWLWGPIFFAGLGAGLWTNAQPPCGVGSNELTGRFLARPAGGAAPFMVVHGSQSNRRECEARVVLLGGGAGDVIAGAPVRLSGEWREGRAGPWFGAQSVVDVGSGRDGANGWSLGNDTALEDRLRWHLVRWRATLVDRIHRLFGDRGPIVSALILARREGLDPELRRAFAETGTAHLLAISGFHVGVVYGLFQVLAALVGMTRRRAALASAAATWAYVAIIGFPDAASRAAAIVAFVAVARSIGRPQARWGPLGGAALMLLALDPSRLWSVGFQLSFVGAAGLVAWMPPLNRAMRRIRFRIPVPSGPLPRLPNGLARTLRRPRRLPRRMVSALAAGFAATAATTPVVAWHFEQVALIGIPATLVASPAVALAVPGCILALLLDFMAPAVAVFLANGVGAVLGGLEAVVWFASTLPGANAWVSKTTVQVVAAGVVVGALLIRRTMLRRSRRVAILTLWVAVSVSAWPLILSLSGRGTLRLHFIDVGQGDAIAIRTPASRWILVDTGPPTRRPGDPHPVVREMRRLGVGRLEALVLTHPDLDHIGGAMAVLGAVDVGEIVDPAIPSGRPAYVTLLSSAESRGIPWRRALAGQTWTVDGVDVTVLAPEERPIAGDTEANASSVVMVVSHGDFDVLLTGDAPAEVELAVLPELAARAPALEVLKVGHHGSDTSTDPLLLERVRPRVAILSLGRNNRYGHPKPIVVRRLVESGASIYRTDREGSVTVTGWPDGSYEVSSARVAR